MRRVPLSVGVDHGLPWMQTMRFPASSCHGVAVAFVASTSSCPTRDCGSLPIPQHLPLPKRFQEGKIAATTWVALVQNSIPRHAGAPLLSFHEFRKHQPPMSPFRLFSPTKHPVPLTALPGERKMGTSSQRCCCCFQLRKLWLYVYLPRVIVFRVIHQQSLILSLQTSDRNRLDDH